jgi:hypothetical protein
MRRSSVKYRHVRKWNTSDIISRLPKELREDVGLDILESENSKARTGMRAAVMKRPWPREAWWVDNLHLESSGVGS